MSSAAVQKQTTSIAIRNKIERALDSERTLDLVHTKFS
jgi:hypothetical protein